MAERGGDIRSLIADDERGGNRARSRYPTQVGGLTVYDRYQEELANSYQANMAAGNTEAARVNQFELSGRILARNNRGRAASTGFGMAEAFGLGDWFADTAGAVAGVENREAMPRTRDERAAWRHGLRAGMQTENPVGYYGGQIIAALPAAEALATRATATVAGRVAPLAAREGQRFLNVARAAGVGAAAEAPIATVRAANNQISGRYEDEGRGPSAAVEDIVTDTGLSAGLGGTLNALGAAAAPASRGVARWFGFDPEGVGLLARRSAEAQLQDGGRLERFERAGALDVDLRPSSVVSPADAAEVARLSARSRAAQAGLGNAAADEIQRMQAGMQRSVRRAADAVDMREAPVQDTGLAPAGDARTATETPMDFSRQPLTEDTGVRRTTIPELDREAGSFADEAMASMEAQNPTVIAPRELVDSLLGPGLGDNIGRVVDPSTGTSAYGALADIVQASGEGPVIIPLRLLESIRSGVNNLGKIDAPGVTPEGLRNVETAIRTTIRSQVPAYGTYLDQLAAMGDVGRVGRAAADSGASPATGFRGGQRVLNESPDVFADAARQEGGPGNIGRAEGAVAQLADETGRSPSAAIQLADQLANPSSNVRSNVRTAIGPNAAAPLEDVSQTVAQGADRQAEINRPLISGGQRGTEGTRTAGGILATLGGRGSAFSIAGLSSQLEDMLAAPPAMVNRLARALSTRDLNEAKRVLGDMDRSGVNLQRWNEFAGTNMPGLVSAATPQSPVQERAGDRAPVAPVTTQAGPVPDAAADAANSEAAATLEGMLRDAYAEGDDAAATDFLDQLDRLQARDDPTAGTPISTPEELESKIRDAYAAGDDALAGSLLDEYDRQAGAQ